MPFNGRGGILLVPGLDVFGKDGLDLAEHLDQNVDVSHSRVPPRKWWIKR
jgi:hypothetical protein